MGGPQGGTEHFDVISNAGETVSNCAEDLSQQLTELEATVTSESPWGQDEAGSMFGMLYTAVLGQALESISSHVTLLETGGQQLSLWEQTSRSNEDANEQDADNLDPTVVKV